MRKSVWVLALVALSGCAMIRHADPVPVEARLWADRVDVRFSNARTCVGGWAGQSQSPLGGCPEGWRVAVMPEEGTNPARVVVGAVLEALTLGDLLAPPASVTVTGPDGRTWSFVSPPPVER